MRGVFRVCAALFLIFCFFSCARVPNSITYEIIVPTDIYAGLSGKNFFSQGRITELYSEKTAREVFSSDKYSVIVVDEAAEAVSPRKKPDNVFVLAKVGYEKVKSDVFSGVPGAASGGYEDSVAGSAESGTGASFADGMMAATAGFADSGTPATDSGLSAEIARTYYYPCVPFDEDLSANVDKLAFYKLSDIPMGYIILPVRADDSFFHADDPDYPLYEDTLLKCDFSTVPGEPVASSNPGATGENAASRKSSAPDAQIEAVRASYENARVVCAALFNEELLPLVKQEPEAHPDVFFVAAVGDIILSRGVQEAMFYADSPEPVFTDTIPILKNNDFTIGNLEGAVTARTENAQKTYTFKFNKKALPYLKEVGFDYLMLTNNHCYDYGEPGFKDTLQAVAAAGFATSGAGLDKDEAMQFYRTTLNGHAVSVLSFGAYPVEQSGFNGKTMAAATEEHAGILWESDEVLEMIREEKKTGALIIVNIHGGSEYVTKPTKSQRTLYEKVCDAGADVIFGSHPHVLQPIEWYGDSLIVWSLGNFVFPGMDEMPGATDTMIVRLGFVDGRLLYYEKFPAYIDNTAVRLKK